VAHVVHAVEDAQVAQFAVQTVAPQVPVAAGPVHNNPAVQLAQVAGPSGQVAQPVTVQAEQRFAAGEPGVTLPKPGAQPAASQKPALAHVRQLGAHAVHTVVVAAPAVTVETNAYPCIQLEQPAEVQPVPA